MASYQILSFPRIHILVCCHCLVLLAVIKIKGIKIETLHTKQYRCHYLSNSKPIHSASVVQAPLIKAVNIYDHCKKAIVTQREYVHHHLHSLVKLS